MYAFDDSSLTVQRTAHSFADPIGQSNATTIYLKKELKAARLAIKDLDASVQSASCFREECAGLLEECERAVGRLEQAIATRETPELMVVASEIKVTAKRARTLVEVHGKRKNLGKLLNIINKKKIIAKFGRTRERFSALLPPPEKPSTSAISVSTARRPSNDHLGRASSSPTKAGAATSVILRQGKHDKVYSAAFVPYNPAVFPYSCVWWSLGQQLELYSESAQCTTAFPIDGSNYMVTTVAIDELGNVWTGHAKGIVRVRRKQAWDTIMEEKFFSSAIRCISFDEAGRAWVGDEAGRLQVISLAEGVSNLELVHGAQGGPGSFLAALKSLTSFTRPSFKQASYTSGHGASAQGSFSTRHSSITGNVNMLQGSSAACNAAAAPYLVEEDNQQLVARLESTTLPQQREAPVRSIFIRDGRAWVAGGRHKPWLQLWGTSPVKLLHTYELLAYGACHALAAIPWAADHAAPPTRYPSNISSPSNFSNISLPRLQSAMQSNTGAAESVASEQPGDAPGWRLVTGHEGGQLLLWHPAAAQLQPIMKIEGSSSSVRGIMVFDSCGLMCTGHANGELVVFKQLAMDVQISSGAADQPAGIIRPRKASIKAHRLSMHMMLGHGNSCVTIGSTGSIKLWSVEQLQQEGARQGLSTLPSLNLSKAMSTGTSDFSSMSRHPQDPRLLADPATHPDSAQVYAARPHQDSMQSQYGVDSRAMSRTATAPAAEPPRASSAASSPRGLTPSASTGQLNLKAMAQRSLNSHTALSWTNEVPGMASGAGSGQPSSAAGLPMAPPLLMAPFNAGDRPSSPHPSSGPYGFDPAYGYHLLQPAPTSPMQIHPGALSPYASSSMALYPPTRTTSSNVALPLPSRRQPSGPAAPSPDLAANSFCGPVLSSQRSGMESAQHSPRRTNKMLTVHACQTIEHSEIVLKEVIGTGAYGKVWLADWQGAPVAVKELLGFSNRQHGSDDEADEALMKEWANLMNEVHLLGSLTHPNIMRFCAVCLDPPMIVMQYYAHGSLFEMLKRAHKGDKRAHKELSWTKRLSMLRDVAAGMSYLHSRRPPVIHGDLRSPNLLLDLAGERSERPRFHLKIADFGLAKMLGTSMSIPLTKSSNPRWTAPEVIRDSRMDKAADVYSFAIIMWELLTWQQPYKDMMSIQVMYNAVTQHQRPSVPALDDLPGNPGPSLPLYTELMERCWADSSETRPSFADVIQQLEGMSRMEASRAEGTSTCSTPRSCSTPRPLDSQTSNITDQLHNLPAAVAAGLAASEAGQQQPVRQLSGGGALQAGGSVEEASGGTASSAGSSSVSKPLGRVPGHGPAHGHHAAGLSRFASQPSSNQLQPLQTQSQPGSPQPRLSSLFDPASAQQSQPSSPQLRLSSPFDPVPAQQQTPSSPQLRLSSPFDPAPAQQQEHQQARSQSGSPQRLSSPFDQGSSPDPSPKHPAGSLGQVILNRGSASPFSAASSDRGSMSSDLVQDISFGGYLQPRPQMPSGLARSSDGSYRSSTDRLDRQSGASSAAAGGGASAGLPPPLQEVDEAEVSAAAEASGLGMNGYSALAEVAGMAADSAGAAVLAGVPSAGARYSSPSSAAAMRGRTTSSSDQPLELPSDQVQPAFDFGRVRADVSSGSPTPVQHSKLLTVPSGGQMSSPRGESSSPFAAAAAAAAMLAMEVPVLVVQDGPQQQQQQQQQGRPQRLSSGRMRSPFAAADTQELGDMIRQLSSNLPGSAGNSSRPSAANSQRTTASSIGGAGERPAEAQGRAAVALASSGAGSADADVHVMPRPEKGWSTGGAADPQGLPVQEPL